MNAGTQTARSAPLSLAATNEVQTQKSGFSADFQDLCSLAMDQALGIEKASLSTVVSLEFMRTRYLSGSSAVQPRIRQSFRPGGSSRSLLYRIANELAHPVGTACLVTLWQRGQPIPADREKFGTQHGHRYEGTGGIIRPFPHTPRAGRLGGNFMGDTSVWKVSTKLGERPNDQAAEFAEKRPVFDLLCK